MRIYMDKKGGPQGQVIIFCILIDFVLLQPQKVNNFCLVFMVSLINIDFKPGPGSRITFLVKYNKVNNFNLILISNLATGAE